MVKDDMSYEGEEEKGVGNDVGGGFRDVETWGLRVWRKRAEEEET